MDEQNQSAPGSVPPITPVVPGIQPGSGQEGTQPSTVPTPPSSPQWPPQPPLPAQQAPGVAASGFGAVPTVGTPVVQSPEQAPVEFSEGPSRRNQILLIVGLSVLALGLGAGVGLLLNTLGISLFG